MMNHLELKMNRRAINQAVESINTLKASFNTLDAADAKTRAEYTPDDGENGKRKMEAAFASTNEKRENARKVARKAVSEASTSYFSSIDEQVILSGSQLDQNDYALIHDGLIKSERELTPLLEKYRGNPAMRRAISVYAGNNGWDGFEDITTEKNLREFGETFFDHAAQAAENPNGISGMTLRNPSAIVDMQRGYSLLTAHDWA